ncbi:MAG: aminotransferase class IV [Thermoleophilia bacterium]|nr:aminotransferase class IV [Thermoleophilia bacterium]
MRRTLVNGREMAEGAAVVPPDDALARAGDALIETMRACGGRVWQRERHMARLRRSAAALGYAGFDAGAVDADVDAALAGAGPGPLRVRVCVSAAGLRWVEVADALPASPAPALSTALTVPGGWMPSFWFAEHKTASRAHLAHAQRTMRASGVGTALLLDAAGRLGEGIHAAAFAVVDGEVMTAPVRGILPGVGRDVLRERMPEVVERAATRDEWRAATEVFTVSAFAGVTAITAIDDAPVADGGPGPGPVARRAALALHDAARSGARGAPARRPAE